MKSVYRTSVVPADSNSQVSKMVLAQPATGVPAIVAALGAAVAALSGSTALSADLIGTVDLDATAGGTGTLIFYQSQVRQTNGQNFLVGALSNAIVSPATPAIIHAIDALSEDGEVQSIHQLASIDIDATV